VGETAELKVGEEEGTQYYHTKIHRGSVNESVLQNVEDGARRATMYGQLVATSGANSFHMWMTLFSPFKTKWATFWDDL
jgi:hypothetical protein